MPKAKIVNTNISCTDLDYLTLGLDLTFNVPMVLALVQAIQFIVDHKKEYLKEYDCENCYKALEESRTFFTDMLIEAEKKVKLSKGKSVKN